MHLSNARESRRRRIAYLFALFAFDAVENRGTVIREDLEGVYLAPVVGRPNLLGMHAEVEADSVSASVW